MVKPRSFMKCTACTVSATLWEKEPSPQSPSDPPSPRLSKRNIPIPSAASCLQIRLAAGLSLPNVKPCENTPHPRAGPSGRSITPASRGPLVLANHTRSVLGMVRGALNRSRVVVICALQLRRPTSGSPDRGGDRVAHLGGQTPACRNAIELAV